MEKKKFYNYAAIAAILFVLILIIIFFLNGRETRITKDEPEIITSSVLCSANDIEEAFFTPSSSADAIKNEIKILFENDVLSRLFYTYTGVYGSLEKVEHEDAVLHARYNIYFGDYNASPSILSPVFSETDSKLIITLYAENAELINNVTAKLFFINDDIIDIFKEYSKEEVKSYYEEQGFKCKINE